MMRKGYAVYVEDKQTGKFLGFVTYGDSKAYVYLSKSKAIKAMRQAKKQNDCTGRKLRIGVIDHKDV